MYAKSGFSALLIAALFGLLGSLLPQCAQARNIPGSANVAIPSHSEASAASIMGGIFDGLLRVRGDDRRQGVTRSSFGADVTQGITPKIGSVAFIGEDGHGMVLNLDYRNVDNDLIDGNLFTGSALLLYRTSERALLFGGLVGETSSVKTPYNDGTIKSRGTGGAIGADILVGDRLSLIGALAFLSLDYDVTRSGGAITGTFGADRIMAELQATDTVYRPNSTLIWNAGIRYLHQNNGAYVESGGAVIGASSHETLSALAGARMIFDSAGMNPFLEGDVRYDVAQLTAFPAGVVSTDDERLHVRLGGGFIHTMANSIFELGVGAHMTENGYDGLDGRLRVLIRF